MSKVNRERGARWKALRAWVFRRDGYVCRKCGLHGQLLECDHVIPRDKGGSDHPSNLQTLCVGCHFAKTRAENKTHQVEHQDEWEAFATMSPTQRRRPDARF